MAKTTKNSGGTVAPSKPAIAFEDFFTRERANTGVKLPLALPDGTPTDFFIQVRGVDSDGYRAAQSAQRSRMIALIGSTPDGSLSSEELEKLEAEEKLLLFTALVIDWNLPKACTPENVKAFLIEAPQIAKQIDVLTAKRALFFRESLKSFTTSPAKTSS